MKALLILIFVCACATAALLEKYTNVDGRIVNGGNATRHQFPYMVSIQSRERHSCGASILTHTWLVSAAHCFYNKPHHFVAVAGLLTQGESRPDIQSSPIEAIIIHPGYNGRFNYNDIALLNLRFPFTFNEAVQRVVLPQPNVQPNAHVSVVVSGWGTIYENPRVTAPNLRYLEMDLITNEECNVILATTPPSNESYPFLVRNTMICTMPIEMGESACHGDSGGPLVQNNVLVGIVHAGDALCQTTLDTPYPNIFTKISSFIDFIKEHVKFDEFHPAV